MNNKKPYPLTFVKGYGSGDAYQSSPAQPSSSPQPADSSALASIHASLHGSSQSGSMSNCSSNCSSVIMCGNNTSSISASLYIANLLTSWNDNCNAVKFFVIPCSGALNTQTIGNFCDNTLHCYLALAEETSLICAE